MTKMMRRALGRRLKKIVWKTKTTVTELGALEEDVFGETTAKQHPSWVEYVVEIYIGLSY